MPRKPQPAAPQAAVVMTVDAFKELYAFHQQLHGIVRTMQPQVLLEIGYENSPDQQLWRVVFEGLAERLEPVMAACVWVPNGDGPDGLPVARRVH
ncbi:hypothetical protein [Lysobacter sp. Root667]|uniref:hypothetical protein n=1 Tax=Lysobacter sp. Root667 TaxID=1736581 RepID=UPI000B0F6E13|nr:hypothetical protein [Lysobacter sp. Root667]